MDPITKRRIMLDSANNLVCMIHNKLHYKRDVLHKLPELIKHDRRKVREFRRLQAATMKALMDEQKALEKKIKHIFPVR